MKTLSSVCVYCGASSQVADVHKEAAHALGDGLARRGIRLVYGGGRVGLMGIVADAALAAGGEVVGIIPEHIQSAEIEHTGLTELHVVDSMHTRKRMMVERSDAFVVLPGGLGTLDEMFEVLTWKQLQLHDKPVVIADVDGYWRPLLGLVDHMVAQGFARIDRSKLYSVADQVDGVFDALERLPDAQTATQTRKL
ncbi:TIGR00730 family Rossman fold protein [Azospirillum doebereinerae]|uniref:Cytokinin riboside 5'-monophosphate phosphoribohydrolase n=1 Tax=Azospirillum doebereinerae TaxID=92933 RepID=A0A3S0WQT7_9PROT|nr:TIGR00730 family Rossman fold protein [Azospirillum doebereinerae]MCG5244171.1 TIGR00730 family Rossman fold protein [Azospirillum doebereinerae]RUQ62507.1 TIGR00730 family Rossman fold protein [Azospirillum doebereinerae]